MQMQIKDRIKELEKELRQEREINKTIMEELSRIQSMRIEKIQYGQLFGKTT